jgi:hypothetical protein
MNRRLLASAVVGLTVFILVAAMWVRYAQTQAILSVFNQRLEIAKECTVAVHWPDGKPVLDKDGKPVKRLNVRKCVSRIHDIDVSACPKRFRLAWLDYLQAIDHLMEKGKDASSDLLYDVVDFGEAAVAYKTGHPILMLEALAKPVQRFGTTEAAIKQAGYNLTDANYNLKRIAIQYGVRFVPEPAVKQTTQAPPQANPFAKAEREGTGEKQAEML